jgi:hypothetical protein
MNKTSHPAPWRRQIAAEVVNARVWAGIHWRTSATVGRHVGEEVGIYALFRDLSGDEGCFTLPLDRSLPAVI